MDNQPAVSFIIPVYNETEVFASLIERMDELIAKMDEICEVVLIDDGSKDNTAQLMEALALKDPKYHCVFLSRNFGHQKALSAGLDSAKGDLIMLLDADLQDPPELFFDFKKIIEEGYDIVYGVRRKRKESFLKKLAYNSFYRLINQISNYPIPKDSGDFGMITRPVLNAINANREESRFLRGIRSWVGFKQVGFEYERQARAAGDTKYTLSKMFKLAMDGIFNYTTLPIKLLSVFGTICIIGSLIYFALTLFKKYMYGDVPTGFTALLFAVILFGGFQLLSLGIIGEYIQRIFFQVKERPLYIIKNKIINGQKVNE
ncbi:MAG: glycosyltransferase family 2 protein [Bacteroidia bacterium]|nr:glycosyltransferase family 2 protein [Bacteroidia bacterium]NNC85505.1 glycosyltransferase family 2 protein [Bacteroidia bacterium]NNM16506.1 glycosyltransferase family 2 protein [Bacteroidia bacterium]